MKKRCFYWIFSLILLVGSSTACRTKKTGCPMNEEASSGVDRKGNLNTKRGKSTLFGEDKKYKKRKRRHR